MADNYQINVEVVNKTSATLNEISSQLGSIGSSASKFGDAAQASFSKATNAAQNLEGALSAIGLTLSVKAALDYVDTIQTMDNKLRLVTSSQADLNSTYSQLYDIAQNTYKPLNETVNLYSKLALSQKDIGLSTEDLMKVTESFNKTLVISGTSTQGASAALYQFAQAMQSGRLQGDELRTMLEVNPVLMKVLQEQTGLTTAELRKLASDGLLTAKVVGYALADSLDNLNGKMDLMPKTVGQAITQISNHFQSLVRSFLDAADGNEILVGAFNLLDKVLGPITIALGVFVAGLAFAGIAKSAGAALGLLTLSMEGLLAATTATTTALTFLATTPMGRVISLVGLAAAGFVAFGDKITEVINPSKNLGSTTDKLSDQTDGLTDSQSRARKALEESGAMAKLTETAFSKYLDSIKEQIKYSNLFSDERKNMIDIDKALQKTVDDGRKTGTLYTQEQLANMRAEAEGLIRLRDEKLKITQELEDRYKGYVQYIKTNQDKALTDQEEFDKKKAQFETDSATYTMAQAEKTAQYLDALRANYSKKYVDLIVSESKANMTEAQKFATDVAKLEADRDAGRLSQDLNFNEAMDAIRSKYGKKFFDDSEAFRLAEMTSYEKYQTRMLELQTAYQDGRIKSETEYQLLVREATKKHVDSTTQEYSNLYGYLNNKLLEMTGVSKEKWGIMTDIIKLFGVDTNKILAETFTMAIDIVKGFSSSGTASVFTMFSSTQNGSVEWGNNLGNILSQIGDNFLSIFSQVGNGIAGTFEWLSNGISYVMDQSSQSTMFSFANAFDWIVSSASSLAGQMGNILGDVFDWAVSNIGDIASSISGWMGSGGGGGGSGGGMWGTLWDVGTAVVDWFGGLFAKGAAFEGGNIVKRYAQGDIISGPTTFSMVGGTGLMGEAGPEAIMPLTRTSNGDLGVMAINGKDANTQKSVNVNFTINAIDSTSVKDMLIGNQTTITNIIRNAVQERGPQQAIGVAY